MPKASSLLAAFVSGGVIMGLELGASRLLAPYFGYSIYIWGSLIGVVMMALATGYFLGGWLIDRNPTDSILYKVIFASALLIAIIPIHSLFVLSVSSLFGLIAGSLVSAMVIFGPPMTLLAMVSPIVIRLQSKKVEDVGKTSGFVYALSTVGSVAGTFITAFYLIPAFGTQKTILGFSVILFLISALRVGSRLRTAFLLILPVGFLIPVILQSFFTGIIYHTESEYNVIDVYRDGNMTALILGYTGGVQTVSYRNQTLTGMYYDYFNLAPILTKKFDGKVLFMGAAGGTSIKQLLHFFNVTIDAVEIDSKVVHVGKEYFGINESERLHIYVEDGRSFIKTHGNYDAICIDVFAGGFDIPFHLATREFFMDVKKSLNDDGIMMMNVLAVYNDTRLVDSLANTVHSVFPSVYVLETGPGNRMLMAFMDETGFEDLNFLYPDEELAGVLNKSRQMIKFDKTNDLIFTDDRTRIEEMSFDMMQAHIKEMNIRALNEMTKNGSSIY